jgi:phytoene desaturase
MSSSPEKTLIIGAGIAGIAAAIRLAVKGYQVEVYEANAYAGGKLAELKMDGYRFDAGPSLFTMPQYVDELFTLAGKKREDYLQYRQLDVICTYFYEDGTRIKSFADEEKMTREMTMRTGESPDAIRKHTNYSRRIYQITNPVFLQKSLHRAKTYLSTQTALSFLQLFRIDAFRSMHKANKHFFGKRQIVQYFDRYATYNGSNPYEAPATLNVIPHLEQQYGAWFPSGGMYNIITSLVKLAEETGVKFHYNIPIDEIILSGRKVTGVKVNGKMIEAGRVISNADVHFTYKKLLSAYPHLHPVKTLNRELSSSAIVFYWGIKKRFELLDLHNIFFSADYRREFECIWQKKAVYTDPTVYLNISARLQLSDAPDGCGNWFVMVNAPANYRQDWELMINIARESIIKKLSKHLGEDIRKLIACEEILDPRTIAQRTSSYRGAIYGASSNSALSAFLRHPNRSGKISNLYFCGGSVHPGGGIPLALLSAKIVADWIG